MRETIEALTQEQMHATLADAVERLIAARLAASRPGHCMRVGALPNLVMYTLCERFNADGVDADVVLLRGPRQPATAPWHVSATRLVELRNVEERPLVAFIPPGIKVPAEDSFDISTFQEISLGNVPALLCEQLRAQLPEDVRHCTDEATRYLQQSERTITTDDIVRY